MIDLLDYILDNEDNFWIVSKIIDNTYYGYLVYKVSDEGKYNYKLKKNYTKEKEDGLIKIPNDYKFVFKPQEFYLNNKNNLKGIWKEYVNLLNEIGIKDEDIGIFGSYLIGFDITKDVDYIIYGKDNLVKYYNNIDYIRKKLNVTPISLEHIEYQYQKHKDKFPIKCDLKEIISRNWSGIELDNGVLSTPRFIDKTNMSIPSKKGIDKVIEVTIKEGFYSVMLPREAKVLYNDQEYKMLSSIWKFQSFAHLGDILEIYANVDDENRLIILDDNKYYIKYIKKSNKIL